MKNFSGPLKAAFSLLIIWFDATAARKQNGNNEVEDDNASDCRAESDPWFPLYHVLHLHMEVATFSGQSTNISKYSRKSNCDEIAEASEFELDELVFQEIMFDHLPVLY